MGAALSRAVLGLLAWAHAAGPAGPLLYGLSYVLATVLFLPGSVLTLGAGFAYGVVGGMAVVVPASVAGALLPFVLGRTVLRDRIARRLQGVERFQAIDQAIAEQGFRVVLLLRLSPVLPFNLLNYALGLTRVGVRDYLLGSLIGMFPGTLLYVYLGSLVNSATEFAAGQRPSAGLAGELLFGGGLLATVLATVLVTRAARRALERTLGTGGVVDTARR
jgi:uncharacterized membrane protein YdjX (TVP38/TMEM64 family)